jgi:demethylmenaquinone methyltransferase/2-methoxy-6-polyprenyl-1,4-benzoquinol methylase
MAHLTGPARSAYVSRMFDRIAGHYDRLNRVMTFGQDRRWRRRAVRLLQLPPSPRVLDLGAGTGDLSIEILRQQPQARATAADFSLPMLRVGQTRSGDGPTSPLRSHVPTPDATADSAIRIAAEGRSPSGPSLASVSPASQSSPGNRIGWVMADALHLPFRNGIFDGIVSGFLMRNVADVPAALAEQARILRPGGHLVCLDTTPPPATWLRPLLRFHLHVIIPLLGRLLAGDAEAYNYLPDSTERFLEPAALAEALSRAGLENARFERWMLGTVAIHCAQKPIAAPGGSAETRKEHTPR